MSFVINCKNLRLDKISICAINKQMVRINHLYAIYLVREAICIFELRDALTKHSSLTCLSEFKKKKRQSNHHHQKHFRFFLMPEEECTINFRANVYGVDSKNTF